MTRRRPFAFFPELRSGEDHQQRNGIFFMTGHQHSVLLIFTFPEPEAQSIFSA
jgi:hypothetical protein